MELPKTLSNISGKSVIIANFIFVLYHSKYETVFFKMAMVATRAMIFDDLTKGEK
jgi:hypothetical protein